MLIDTHAHLYSRKFDNDRHEMIRRAMAAGVERMYLPNIDESSIEPMLELEAAFPRHCFAMMGVHPCSVQPDTWHRELEITEKWLGERAWAAVGETGLDLYWDKSTLDIQKKSFSRHIEWAKDLKRPLVIHSRDSTSECIEMVRQGQDGRLKGVFHCFSDGADEAKQIIDLGFMLGIGGVLTYAKSNLPEALKDIPLEYLVLETDAPYLPPTPHRGKRNESAYVVLVAEKLAEIKGVNFSEICQITTRNALRLFEDLADGVEAGKRSESEAGA